ncbi:MAG: AsmA family protein [Pigmentiphaga sp.]
MTTRPTASAITQSGGGGEAELSGTVGDSRRRRHPGRQAEAHHLIMGGSARRGLILLAALLAAFVMLAALAPMALQSWVGSAAGKSWIERQLGAVLERTVRIGGDLSLHWQASSNGGRWLPAPRFDASNVTIANPEWASHTDFASVGRLQVSVALLPLLSRHLVFELIELQDARLQLERDGRDRNNWRVGSDDDTPGAWTVTLEALRLGSTTLRYTDRSLALDLEAQLTRASADARDDATAFTLSGRYQQASLHGEGSSGSLFSLADPAVEYPLRLSLQAGDVRLSADGRIGNLRHDPAVALRVAVSGPSMADLYPLTGLVLPRTAPFQTTGTLQGTLGPRQAAWHYQDFTGRMGESDIAGNLSYQSRLPRPLLTAKVQSKQLQLVDVGPLIGLDATDEERPPRRPQSAERVLPDVPFLADRWQFMDVDLDYHAEQLRHGPRLLSHDVTATATLHNQQMRIDPLAFDLGGGRVQARFVLDGHRDPVAGEAHVRIADISLADILRTAGESAALSGTMAGQLQLTGHGDSLAALLASGDGTLRLSLDKGHISHYLLELAALDLLNAAFTRAFKNDTLPITCADADFDVRAGVARATHVQLQTSVAYLEVTGNVNLGPESLDLTLHPHTLAPRLFSLRSPIRITGSFRHPRVTVEKGPLLLRAGIAATLGAIAPPLALLPLTTLGSKAPPCIGRTAHP